MDKISFYTINEINVMNLPIQHQDLDQAGVFFIEQDQGVKIAEIRYRWKNEQQIIADHTWVDDALRGKNIAHILLDELVKFAREKEIKIIPSCSYVDVMFRRKKEYADVIA